MYFTTLGTPILVVPLTAGCPIGVDKPTEPVPFEPCGGAQI
jgi:hypothetical protein